jgi:hypothetical protein
VSLREALAVLGIKRALLLRYRPRFAIGAARSVELVFTLAGSLDFDLWLCNTDNL